MNKAELLIVYGKTVKYLGLKKSDVVVGAGGSMLLFGLRESTHDLDIAIPKKAWDKLKAKDIHPFHTFTNPSGDTVEVIELEHVIGYPVDVHRKEHHVNTMMVDGVCTYTPGEVLKQKEALNRDKDQEDIRKLKELLKHGILENLNRRTGH